MTNKQNWKTFPMPRQATPHLAAMADSTLKVKVSTPSRRT
jgi:hypothetical protein